MMPSARRRVVLTVVLLLLTNRLEVTGTPVWSRDREPSHTVLVGLPDGRPERRFELWLRNDGEATAQVRLVLLSPVVTALEAVLLLELAPGERRSLGEEDLPPGSTVARIESDGRVSAGTRFRHASHSESTQAVAAPEPVASASVAGSGVAWIWPVADDRRAAVGQDYATFNALGDSRYHSGLDIGYPTGTEVRFVASGSLVRIQRLHQNDHGFGNSVVARHRSLAGADVYVQYSHLDSINASVLAACGPPDANQRSQCSGEVGAGASVGRVGRSGKGSRTHWTASHLHLEVKTFPSLSARGDDGGGVEYGYSLLHPDRTGTSWPQGARYFDPLAVGFHVVSAASGSRRAGDDGSVHVGPGGSEDGAAGYRLMARLRRGVGYRVTARAVEPYCPGGLWVQVEGPGLFDDLGLATGEVPDGWTCESHLESATMPTPPSPTPSPQPTPAPIPAPAKPVILALSPAAVVGSSFTLTIDGTGFDSSSARDEVYRPDGSYLGGGAVASRSSTRVVTRESMAGAAPGSYTVRVRTANGLSNGATLRLLDEVAVSPTVGPRGTKFSYTGRGFTGSFGVTSHLRRPDGSEYPTLQIPTTATGAFAWTVDSANLAPGQYELWALDNNTGVASNRVAFRVQ